MAHACSNNYRDLISHHRDPRSLWACFAPTVFRAAVGLVWLTVAGGACWNAAANDEPTAGLSDPEDSDAASARQILAEAASRSAAQANRPPLDLERSGLPGKLPAPVSSYVPGVVSASRALRRYVPSICVKRSASSIVKDRAAGAALQS